VTLALPLDAEWLESDAMGGFASGTLAGYRTRRYHALLLTSRCPPTDRVVLVNGIEAWVDAAGSSFPLSTQHYAPDVIYPRGIDYLADFTSEPWPTWTFDGPDRLSIRQELLIDRASGDVLLIWRLLAGGPAARLHVRPMLSGREYHALMRENGAFDFAARTVGRNVTWRPYGSLPAIAALTTGTYAHEPLWYRNFLYREEAARGLDCIEDLASPGGFTFDLHEGDAILVLRPNDRIDDDAQVVGKHIRDTETGRRAPLSPLDRAADAYVVHRGDGLTIIAGFPWFTDWGRDTFIAMRGLVIARGRYDVAASILLDWAEQISEGMLPNRFPDHGERAEFNSVDASLWYAIAVHDFLAAAQPDGTVRTRLLDAVTRILDSYAAGARFGIHADDDGLLACGIPGVQVTWMDAKVGDHVVTPRIGKPVEVQALWINALRCTGGRYEVMAVRAEIAFRERFWNPGSGCLHDVVDVDHQSGRVDSSIRPNQILGVGGLPFAVVDADVARAIVATVERELLTPLGLRTLAPGDAAYRPRYEGGVRDRDTAYHQGTVWPWLIGPFVDAWLSVNGDDPAHRDEARLRFLAPLQAHLRVAGLGHVSEIADGDPPHTPRGCPFQAWSTGELIRALARSERPVQRADTTRAP